MRTSCNTYALLQSIKLGQCHTLPPVFDGSVGTPLLGNPGLAVPGEPAVTYPQAVSCCYGGGLSDSLLYLEYHQLTPRMASLMTQSIKHTIQHHTEIL